MRDVAKCIGDSEYYKTWQYDYNLPTVSTTPTCMEPPSTQFALTKKGIYRYFDKHEDNESAKECREWFENIISRVDQDLEIYTPLVNNSACMSKLILRDYEINALEWKHEQTKVILGKLNQLPEDDSDEDSISEDTKTQC